MAAVGQILGVGCGVRGLCRESWTRRTVSSQDISSCCPGRQQAVETTPPLNKQAVLLGRYTVFNRYTIFFFFFRFKVV